MTYITDETIREMETRYGIPLEAHVEVEMNQMEYQLMINSMYEGRAHDITLFILDGHPAKELVVIQKHLHPSGVYRAPSGAAHQGEDFTAGAKREAYEETGLDIELEWYILRMHALFTCGSMSQSWISHIFTALPAGRREPRVIDTDEIKEVRWMTFNELMTDVRDRMLSLGSGGLKYRVMLTDIVVDEILQREMDKETPQSL